MCVIFRKIIKKEKEIQVYFLLFLRIYNKLTLYSYYASLSFVPPSSRKSITPNSSPAIASMA